LSGNFSVPVQIEFPEFSSHLPKIRIPISQFRPAFPLLSEKLYKVHVAVAVLVGLVEGPQHSGDENLFPTFVDFVWMKDNHFSYDVTNAFHSRWSSEK
jgi:hypothetical protein